MTEFKKYLISSSSSIKEAIAIIDKNASQIALVADEGLLKGIITDGDVRRALLRGETLDQSVKIIMQKNFKFLPETATQKDALNFMLRQTLKQMPVLDKNGFIKNLFLLDELIKPNYLSNDVVIMAGGQGKRLGDLTKNCPKPMLKFNGKPILETILEQCIQAGFKNFYFSVGYLKEQIQNYFQDGSQWNVKINYLVEVDPLGTAGSLSLLSDLSKYPLLVLNADVLTKVDYNKFIQFHKDHKSSITLGIINHTTKIPYGVIKMDDLDVVSVEEKPVLQHFVNAGIYAIQPSMLKFVPKNIFFDMPELVKLAIKKKFNVRAFPIHEYWQDLGSSENLLQTDKALL